MELPQERILLVEGDAQVSQLIAQETLRPLGYQVEVIPSASVAIKEFASFSPNLIITNLLLPEISGKDLLVALKSQGVDLPIIVITPKGHESDALQAFRLGAVNFLTHPLREAEIVNVVEDTLYQTRRQAKLDNFAKQLAQAEEDVRKQAQRLAEIFSIGKLTPCASNQQTLYNKITRAALMVAEADSAWLAVYDHRQKKFILRASQDGSAEMPSRLNLPYEDDLTSILAVSGSVISLCGDALKRFEPYSTTGALLAVPVIWKDEIIGIITAQRYLPEPFTYGQQELLELVAEYTSMLIENSRRYQVLEQRLFELRQTSVVSTIDSDLKNDLLRQASLELQSPIKSLMDNLDQLTRINERRLSLKQSDALRTIQEEANTMMDIADTIMKVQQRPHLSFLEEIDLNALARQVIDRYQVISRVSRISFNLEFPSDPAMVRVYPSQISKVIEGLISNAIKYSPTKSQLTISIESKSDCIVLTVRDQGDGMDENLVGRLFEKKSSLLGEKAKHFGGIGISLPMVKEIISAHRGEVWVDSGSGKGFAISFSLPRA